MFEALLLASRERSRLSEITAVFAKAGLAGFGSRFGLGRFGAALGLPAREGATEAEAPVRFRQALEELGPVFVKLGQILSTRGDLLPPAWVAELSRLQSGAPQLPWSEIRALIEVELGAPPETVFARIEQEALAAASVAQVHRAWLADGTAVVLKVRRPGLEDVVAADMRLLARLAALAEGRSQEVARYRPREIVRHLTAAIREELDLSNEGRNAEAIAADFDRRPEIVIPRIHADYTTDGLLVQDFLDGIEPAGDGRIEAAGLDGPLLARRGAEAFLSMVLAHGLFHADPHPGNLLALSGNRVGFIDFGAVGRIGEKRRGQLLSFVGAMVAGRSEQVAGVLLEWSAETNPDLGRLEAASDQFIARHGRGSLDLGAAIADVLAIARENSLAFPPDLAVLFKALATADGVMKRLDPAFDAVAAAAPVVRRAALARFGPAALAEKGRQAGLDLARLADDLPTLGRLLVHRLRQRRFEAEISLADTAHLGRHLERSAAIVAIGLVAAAFVLGLAPELLRSGVLVGGTNVFTLVGIVAVVLGLGRLLLALRRGKL